MDKQIMEQKIIETLLDAANVSDDFKILVNQKVHEKTEQQLEYILSPITRSIFLEACAGSGKTEVVGMKAAYEMNKWDRKIGGIAILTFTNEATDTIQERVNQYSNRTSLYPHYIGTLTGFFHGYIAQKFGCKFINSKNQNVDRSYRLIDKNLSDLKNSWLKKYELPIRYMAQKKNTMKIYAHQIYYDYQKEDYIITFTKNSTTLKSYYDSPVFQEFVQGLREKKKKPWLLKYDYIKKQVETVKASFHQDGFANFEDMNNLAYTVLRNNSILVGKIVERYPIIIVDECQDLSWIELEILKILQNAGTTLHFVGDLNQAIYEFKGANPQEVKNFISSFNKMNLTNNFRSSDSIVQVANRVASIQDEINGCAKHNQIQDNVHYIEYDTIQLLRNRYKVFLKDNNIAFDKAIILVRQNSLKKEFDNNNEKNSHPLINSLQLWNTHIPSKQICALEMTGEYLQKWFGTSKNKKSYYCPLSVDSVYRWRIFLKDFLESFFQYPELLNFENITYGEWYKIFRQYGKNILDSAYIDLKKYDIENRDFEKINVRTPNGTTNQAIEIITNINEEEYPIVDTIHNVKGKEYDAVMVVSSINNSPQGTAHWKKWIEKSGEGRRIGYVANTRAKYSLLWALPTLSKEEKDLIESYGFKSLKK